LDFEVEEVYLEITNAIPCGLIVNELITNSLKHAFPGERKGNISIKMSEEKPKGFKLVVSDNGVGFPHEIDFRHTKSMGLQLVNDLVKQLQGSIDLDQSGGTSFMIVFG
jgi:two-component sensor histidine kinase